jgi:hypothetical protein
MKRALLHSTEPGRICEVVEIGQEFEVHDNFTWVDVPDDTTTSDKYQDGSVIKFDPVAVPGFAEHAYKVARGIGYGSIGDQLDMLFKEVAATGTISNTGAWFNHVSSIKTQIPKDDPYAVQAWNERYWESISGNSSPR